MDEFILFHELMNKCQTADKLPDKLLAKINKLDDIERHRLVSRTRNGFTPLYAAVGRGALDIIKYLLVKCKADVDYGCVHNNNNKSGAFVITPTLTPLMCAESVEVARYLVAHGANVNIASERVGSPLIWACLKLRFDIAEFLISSGADINMPMNKGNSSLHYCLKFHPFQRSCEVFQFLLAHGARINTQNDLKQTPLHQAIRSNLLYVVELLLKNGADASLQDKDGSDALQLACRNGHEGAVLCLIKYKKYLNSQVADAYELLGAYAGFCRGFKSVYKMWYKALLIRLRANKKGRFVERVGHTEELQKMFPNITEVRTKLELKSMTSNRLQIVIQALYIYCRVLGPFHHDTIHFVIDADKKYNKKNSRDTDFRLVLKYRLSMMVLCIAEDVSYIRDMTMTLCYSLLGTIQKFAKDKVELFNFYDVLRNFELVCEQLGNKNFNTTAFPTVIALIDAMMSMPKTDVENERMRNSVKQIVRKKYCTTKGDSLLHVAILDRIKRDPKPIEIHPNDAKVYTYKVRCENYVKLLIECGHDVDFVNSAGTTPLHKASLAQSLNIVNCLLKNGAHIDRVDAAGNSPCKLMKDIAGFEPFKYTTLKCLAARTIVKCKVPYDDLNFPALTAFIDYH